MAKSPVRDIIRKMMEEASTRTASDLLVPEGSTVEEVASGDNGGTAVEAFKNSDMLRRLDVQNWLPLAAPVYQISEDARDYVVTPVIIVPTDLPNRNSVAFPYETLLSFNPRQGRPNFKTWVGKPTFSEHANHDHTQSKGIIFDTYMKPINNARGGLHKLIALCGFDRTKDPELARAILKGERASYSMGAFVGTYECSVCKAVSKPGKLNTECGHVVRGKPEMYETAKGMLPSYLLARNSIEGFEVSSVGRPAWVSAVNSRYFDMNTY